VNFSNACKCVVRIIISSFPALLRSKLHFNHDKQRTKIKVLLVTRSLHHEHCIIVYYYHVLYVILSWDDDETSMGC
jgi:hypothetical protein